MYTAGGFGHCWCHTREGGIATKQHHILALMTQKMTFLSARVDKFNRSFFGGHNTTWVQSMNVPLGHLAYPPVGKGDATRDRRQSPWRENIISRRILRGNFRYKIAGKSFPASLYPFFERTGFLRRNSSHNLRKCVARLRREQRKGNMESMF